MYPQSLKTWLRDTLRANATILAQCATRVYADDVPEVATFPYIVMYPFANEDNHAMADNVTSSMAYYQIEAVTETRNESSGATLAAAIDTALSEASGTEGDYIFNCRRTGVISLVSRIRDIPVRRDGGEFLIWIRKDE